MSKSKVAADAQPKAKVDKADKTADAAPALPASEKPYIRNTPVPFSRWQFVKSLEALFSLVLLCGSLYLIFFSPSSMHLTTSRGMVAQSMKKKRARLASRTAQKQAPETAMIYTDLVTIGLVGLATTGFVHGCARRILGAQKRLEEEQTEALREALYNADALAAMQKQVADDQKEWEAENKQREAKGRRKLRPRRTVPAIDMSDVLTNFFVVVTIVLTALVALFVQLQKPNEARGFGAIIMIIVLVGAIICPSFDRSLGLLMKYCLVWQAMSLTWIFAMCFLTVRATWD